MLTSSRKNQKQTKHGRQHKRERGESTLWGNHFGHFHDIYVKYVSTNCIAFNFGFTFDVWA